MLSSVSKDQEWHPQSLEEPSRFPLLPRWQVNPAKDLETSNIHLQCLLKHLLYHVSSETLLFRFRNALKERDYAGLVNPFYHRFFIGKIAVGNFAPHINFARASSNNQSQE
jgi:hypothetical protein